MIKKHEAINSLRVFLSSYRTFQTFTVTVNSLHFIPYTLYPIPYALYQHSPLFGILFEINAHTRYAKLLRVIGYEYSLI